MSSSNCSERRSGFALVAVLWLLVLLSMISMHISAVSRTEAELTRNLTVAAQAHHAAESGVRWAIWSLTLPPEENWLADSSMHYLELNKTEIGVALQDENGKLDLNHVTYERLVALFEAAEIDEETSTPLIDAIIDWRDADDLKRLNGAEDDDYLEAGLSYGAKDAPYESVDELKQVLGMTPEVYERIGPAFTVYVRRSGVNPLVAPRLVLLALQGVDEDTIDRYIEDRRENYENDLPPPETPPFQGKLISPSLQGVYYTIHTEAVTEQGVKAYRKVIVRRRGAAARVRFELLKSSEKKEPLFFGVEH